MDAYFETTVGGDTAYVGFGAATNGVGGGHITQTLSDFRYFELVDTVLGDVNGDGLVGLLDVAPFVNLLTSGQFLPAADINEDLIVDLLDVAPFVDLLTGN